MSVESQFRPPAVCQSCRDCDRCQWLDWAFADPQGATCPAFEASEVRES